MSDFTDDKARLLDDLAKSRGALTAVVERLTADDFERARRGSWPVLRILEHVIHSERLYTKLISVFSGEPVNEPDISSASEEPLSALQSSREAFLTAVAGVDEDNFYRLQTFGHEEYSVLSIMENNASHDREHAEQVRRTVES